MNILLQTIRIIDYENDIIFTREAPTIFSEYVSALIDYINSNKSIREYKTRSNNTEVISCILDIISSKNNEEYVIQKIDYIAKRLLEKEKNAQKSVEHMNINVQKGSLIQALLYDDRADAYKYLLAKVEHVDFVDDSDFSFKSGFSKDTKTIWKTCIFDVEKLDELEYYAKVFSNTSARYWYNDFLELEQVTDDSVNTDKSFRAIDAELSRNVKNSFPRDYTIIRNSLIGYYRTKKYIDYYSMLDDLLLEYQPVDIKKEQIKNMMEKLKELPVKKKFDRQFNVDTRIINSHIKKIYDICPGVQLRITDVIDDLEDTIVSDRDINGNIYIKIKTENETLYEMFKCKEKIRIDM